MEKRGTSHIEMIISFVLFAGAIGFALYFFSPVNNTRVPDSVIDYAFREIMKNATTELEIYFIGINNESIINAGVPAGKIAINVSGVEESKKGKVFTRNRRELKGERGLGGDVWLFKIKPEPLGWDEVNFIEIMFNEELSETSNVGSGEVYNENFYNISRVEKKELISENKMLKLNQSYYANYENLKKDFNLPNRIDFGFIAKFEDGKEIRAEKAIPPGFDVVSEGKRIEVLRQDGKVEFMELTVKVW